MKNVICAVLALASLTSLSACSGQTAPNPTAPVYPMQQNTLSQDTGLQLPIQPAALAAPAEDTAAFAQAPQQQSHAAVTASAATAVIPGSRAYDSSIFNKTPSKTASTAATAKPALTKSTVPVKAVAATPEPVKAPSQELAAQQLISKAVERFKSLESFKIMVEGLELVNGKDPSRLSFNFYSHKGQSKIEVLKHTNSMYVGVKMGYQAGTDAISVRPGGMLGFVKVDTKMTDSRLSTPRGYRLDQIDVFAVSKRLLTGSHQPKVLGKTQINGRNVAVLEYTHANDFDQRITRELLAVDMEDHFIRMHEMYEGTTLVFSLKLSNIQLNAPVSSAELGV